MESEYDALVQELGKRGYTKNRVSQVLDYSGKNGKRDLEAVRSGASRKCSLEKAVTLLRNELERAQPYTKPPPEAGPPPGPSPAPDPDRSPSSASSSSSSESEETQRSRAPKSSMQQFDELVEKLRQKGMSDRRLSMELGYSGKNGPRDLAAVRRGASRTCPISEAIKRFEILLGAAPAGHAEEDPPKSSAPPPPKGAGPPTPQQREMFNDLRLFLLGSGMTEGDIVERFGLAKSDGTGGLADLRDGNPVRIDATGKVVVIPAADVVSKLVRFTEHFGKVRTTSATTDNEHNSESQTLIVRGKHFIFEPYNALLNVSERFEFMRLVLEFIDHGFSKGYISEALGFSGKNGNRDILSVLSGKSRIPLDRAIRRLEAEKKDKLRTMLHWEARDRLLYCEHHLTPVFHRIVARVIAGCAGRLGSSISRYFDAKDRSPESASWRTEASILVAASPLGLLPPPSSKLAPLELIVGDGFEEGAIYARANTPDQRLRLVKPEGRFLRERVDLRWLLKALALDDVISTVACPPEAVFRSALLRGHWAIACMYHGTMKNELLMDALRGLFGAAESLIQWHFQFDPQIRTELLNLKENAKRFAPFQTTIDDPVLARKVALVRIYQAAHADMTDVLSQWLPPEGTTLPVRSLDDETFEELPFDTSVAVRSAMAQPGVDFMTVARALWKMFKRPAQLFVEQHATDRARHGFPLDDPSDSERVVKCGESMARFLANYAGSRTFSRAAGVSSTPEAPRLDAAVASAKEALLQT